MGDITKIPLVSSEIAGLWNSYMADSMAVCVLKFFVNRVEDEETRSILQETLDLSSQHIQGLENFFNLAGLPIPEGFTDKDVNINAPRLFTDEFYLSYLCGMSRAEMLSYTDSTVAPFSEKLMMHHIVAAGFISVSNDGLALAESLRSDLSTTYLRFLTEAMAYSKDGADIMIHNKWFEQPPQAVMHENLARV